MTQGPNQISSSPLLSDAERNKNCKRANDEETNNGHDPVKVSPPVGTAVDAVLFGELNGTWALLSQVYVACAGEVLFCEVMMRRKR